VTFSHSHLLLLVPLLPALVGLAMLLYVRRRRRVAGVLADRNLAIRLVGADLHAVPWIRVILVLVAAAALGMAAAGPRWGLASLADGGRSLDLTIVLDVSNSMLVSDAGGDASAELNRLERQRDAARRLVRQLDGDRIGVVVFAGRAYILSPLTTDRGALELFLDAMDPEIVEQTGSSLSPALRQATNLLALGRDDNAARVMVLISDGEALEDHQAIRDAAHRAARAGITVHTVGIGTQAGGPVPQIDPGTGEQQGFKTDPETGETAWSRLDEALLREVAEITNGSYIALAEPGAMDRLLARLRSSRRAGGGAETNGSERASRFAWFVGFALALLAIDAYREMRPGMRS
jgi:Ca-activated chloride channel family protein